MRRLQATPEFLDGPLDDAALRGNLRDLARFNRWLGGAKVSLQAIEPLGAGRLGALQVLDLGTGAADIPRYLVRTTAYSGPHLSITATDIRPEIATAAREMLQRNGSISVRPGRIEDEPDRSFDIVHSSMVLHHLDSQAAVEFLGQMRRVARVAVIVNDLDRGWRWWIGAWMLTRVFTRNPYTRNDAPLSVRRAYTADEMADMAREAGLRAVAHYRTFPPYRYALVFVADPTRDG